MELAMNNYSSMRQIIGMARFISFIFYRVNNFINFSYFFQVVKGFIHFRQVFQVGCIPVHRPGNQQQCTFGFYVSQLADHCRCL